MPDLKPDRPRRKSMFLGPDALDDLKATASRRRTEREAVEEALRLLAQRDAQMDAMAEFVEWAINEWGGPTREDRDRAEEVWANH